MGKLKTDEEVVDMKPDEKGTYNPIALVKVSQKEDQFIFEPTIPTRKNNPVFYEILGGFVVGLNAIEKLMLAINKNEKKGRK